MPWTRASFESSPAPRRERSGEPVTFVWVGQTGYRKGLDVVLAAFARLRHLVPAVQLLVVGVAAGEPAEGVEWVGPLPPEQVPAVYRRADVLFFPTRYEALPLVVIEAMTAGLPAVVSDAVAPGIVADGRAGYVIAGHDPDDYVPALQRLCDPELRAEMSSQARVESERFSLERAWCVATPRSRSQWPSLRPSRPGCVAPHDGQSRPEAVEIASPGQERSGLGRAYGCGVILGYDASGFSRYSVLSGKKDAGIGFPW